jgi:opacity protein-like surface antigen
MKTSLTLALAMLLGGVSASAAAEDYDWFVRAEAGGSQIEFDGAEGDNNAFSGRVGYFFTPHFAVEGFYSNYGEDQDGAASAKVSGVGVGLVAKRNFSSNDHLDFFISGRVGVARIETEIGVAGLGRIDDDSTNAYAGVGVGWDFAQNLGLSLNYEISNAEAFDVDVKVRSLTLGLEYRF